MLSRCLATATMARLSPCLLALLLALTAYPHVSLANRNTCSGAYQRPHPRGVCGDRLIGIVQQLCAYAQHGLFRRYINKRSTEQVNENMLDLLMNKQDAFSFMSKRSADTLTCACCYNPCTVMELARYCPRSGSRGRRNNRRSERMTGSSSELAVNRRSDQTLDDEYS